MRVVYITGFLPNQGNQGNIREFYFDLKYQGKIRAKKKRNWKSGKFFSFLLITLQKILRIVFNFFNHVTVSFNSLTINFFESLKVSFCVQWCFSKVLLDYLPVRRCLTSCDVSYMLHDVHVKSWAVFTCFCYVLQVSHRQVKS